MNEISLGTEPLNKLMLRMVIPALLAQLVSTLYNIVDRIYIGRIPDYGELALTGVGITFPIVTFIMAFSQFAGSGGAPIASRFLGQEDYQKAENILLNSTSLLIIFSIILSILLYAFKIPLLNMFGASPNTLPYADEYLSIYLIGTLFVQITVGLNPFISAQGYSKIAMLSTLIGAITNIILDPIFIFWFGMGVKGAGWATVISQALSSVWIIYFLSSKKSVLRLSIKKLHLDKPTLLKISALGISPFVMQSTNSLVSIVLNSGFERYGGDIYVGAMTIMSSLSILLTVPLDAFRQGITPILSYNYGAGNIERILGIMKRFILSSAITSIVISGLIILFPTLFVTMFTPNLELIELTSSLVPMFFIGSPLLGILFSSQGCFLAFGLAKHSIFVAMTRKVIILIPLAIILPNFFGVMGLIYAQPIADIIAILSAALTLYVVIKKRII
ncbi:MAG: MATE family efflux transporter [Epulopiscium sp. Nuni2H_MBin003]|nr:MAG: MATE family efflux transporter [Epulopiscium sp. Nuni2H_MBin003]